MKIIDNQKSQWLEQFLNSSHIGVLVVDKNRNNLLVNKHLCEMFGYSEDELLNSTAEIFHINHTSFLNFAELAFNFVLKGKAIGIDYQFIRKDGTLFWVHIAGDAVKNHDEVLWTMVDITQRKSAESKINFLNERMQLALDGNRDVIWDWNLVTKDLYVSSRWKDIIGYGPDEVPYEMKVWRRNIHPDDLRDVLGDITKNIKGETLYLDNTHRVLHRDGTYRWIRIKGKTFYDKDLKPIRMTGTHTDVTFEKELELKNAQQAQMIEQIHDSVISTDLDGNILTFNNGSEILLGYKAQEVIGKNVTILYLKEDYEIFRKNIEILKKNGEHHSEVRFVKKSKEILDVDLSLSLIRDEKSVPIAMVGYSKDITKRKKIEFALKQQQNILYYQAHHDTLTDLPNRILFIDRLEQGIKKSKRNNTKLALFFLDLDHFKEINDSLGHDIGDKVLKEVTSRLKELIRAEDTLARLGGDEFTIIMHGLIQGQDASLLAQKVLKVLAQPAIVDEHTLYVSCSIGISLYPDDGDSVQNLLKYADAAMYKAKDEGRNNYQFYSSVMTELAFERVVMEVSLRESIKNEDFVVFYQPQIDAKNNILVGMEALVRWNHPVMGIVSPAKFIALAESTGLIVDIDRYVMKTAMRQVQEWYTKGLNSGVLALNLSVNQLRQSDFIDILIAMMDEIDFPSKWLALEVTESQIMTNPQEAIKILNIISDLGIELAVDDFGTGYSSLSYLKKLPINKLKIDQSFVKDLPDDEEDSAITKSVIALAKNLNLKIIAEGVETKEQKEFLVKNGCENIQGYFYAKPMPADEMEKFLNNKML